MSSRITWIVVVATVGVLFVVAAIYFSWTASADVAYLQEDVIALETRIDALEALR